MSNSARLYMSLIVDGSSLLEGDVVDADYEQEIEVRDWSWRLSRPVDKDKTPSVKVVPEQFSFSKMMDRATTGMLTLMDTPRPLAAVVTLVRDNDMPFKLVATMEEVRIVSYGLSATDEEKLASIKEDWTFAYRRITIEHAEGNLRSDTTEHVVSAGDDAKRAAAAAAAFEMFAKLSDDDQEKFIQLGNFSETPAVRNARIKRNAEARSKAAAEEAKKRQVAKPEPKGRG